MIVPEPTDVDDRCVRCNGTASTDRGTDECSHRLMVDGMGEQAYRNQLDLMRFATWLRDQGRTATSGYAGSVDDALHRRTTLAWGPDLPPPTDSFRQAIETQAAVADIDLRFERVAYARHDVDQASRFLLESPLVGFPVYAVEGPTPESPHLTVVGKIGASDPDQLGRRLQELLRTDLGVVVRAGDPLLPFAERGEGHEQSAACHPD